MDTDNAFATLIEILSAPVLVLLDEQENGGKVSNLLDNKEFPFLKKCYFGTQSVWSDGYFVSTVGVDEAVIQRYIENQGREDLGQAWLDLK